MMRVAALAVAGFGLSIFCSAQQMPDCASQCLLTHLEESSCGATDFDCICADEVLMGNVELCAMGTCTVLEGLGMWKSSAPERRSLTMIMKPPKTQLQLFVMPRSETGAWSLPSPPPSRGPLPLFSLPRGSGTAISRENGLGQIFALT